MMYIDSAGLKIYIHISTKALSTKDPSSGVSDENNCDFILGERGVGGSINKSPSVKVSIRQ